MRNKRRGLKFYLVIGIISLIIIFLGVASLRDVPVVILLRSIFIVDKLTFFILAIMTIFSFILIKELIDIYILKRNIGHRGKMLKKGTSDE